MKLQHALSLMKRAFNKYIFITIETTKVLCRRVVAIIFIFTLSTLSKSVNVLCRRIEAIISTISMEAPNPLRTIDEQSSQHLDLSTVPEEVSSKSTIPWSFVLNGVTNVFKLKPYPMMREQRSTNRRCHHWIHCITRELLPMTFLKMMWQITNKVPYCLHNCAMCCNQNYLILLKLQNIPSLLKR